MKKNSANLKLVSSLACQVCGFRPVDVHHWKTRGSGGSDELDNLAPLCRKHHTEVHTIGTKTFYKKYEAEIQIRRFTMLLPKLKGS